MKLEQLYQNIGTEYETTLERFCCDEEMLGRFVRSFLKDPVYHRLEEAVGNQDYHEIESQAHTLKGVAGNLGFDRLQAACGEVVLCIRQNRFETIQRDFQNVKQEYETVIHQIIMME